MQSLESLFGIYETYEKNLARATEEASVFAGAFNMGDDPRNHACNQIFYDAVQSWVEDFIRETPTPEEAAQAVEWILGYPHGHREQNTYWYTYAAQKHAEKLIPLLKPEAAARIAAAFGENYPRLDWTPVQKNISSLLASSSGETGKKQVPAFIKGGIWLKRVAALLVGLSIAHLGVTLFLLADLGSDPFNVLIQGLFRMTSGLGLRVTHGTVHVAVSLLIILVLLAVDKSYIRIGTFLCMLLGGPIIDVFTLLLQGLINSSAPMAVRLLAVTLGCGILAFGMTIVIKSEAGTGPNDLVGVVISDKKHWKFGVVRVAVDCCFASVGFLLGGTVGIGTVVCLAVVGPVAQLFMPFSQKLCRKLIGD